MNQLCSSDCEHAFQEVFYLAVKWINAHLCIIEPRLRHTRDELQELNEGQFIVNGKAILIQLIDLYLFALRIRFLDIIPRDIFRGHLHLRLDQSLTVCQTYSHSISRGRDFVSSIPLTQHRVNLLNCFFIYRENQVDIFLP